MTDYDIPDDISSLVAADDDPEYLYVVSLYSPLWGDTMQAKVSAPTLVEAVELALTSTWDRIAVAARLTTDE
jgi:hypothetical protein